jgi:hypothetical protein
LRRGGKKCSCPIYASGTLSRQFKRRNTDEATWPEANSIAGEWQAIGSWDLPLRKSEQPEPPPPVPQPLANPDPSPAVSPRVTIQDALAAYLAIREGSGIAEPRFSYAAQKPSVTGNRCGIPMPSVTVADWSVLCRVSRPFLLGSRLSTDRLLFPLRLVRLLHLFRSHMLCGTFTVASVRDYNPGATSHFELSGGNLSSEVIQAVFVFWCGYGAVRSLCRSESCLSRRHCLSRFLCGVLGLPSRSGKSSTRLWRALPDTGGRRYQVFLVPLGVSMLQLRRLRLFIPSHRFHIINHNGIASLNAPQE